VKFQVYRSPLPRIEIATAQIVRLHESDNVVLREAFRQHPERRVHARFLAGEPAIAAIDDCRFVREDHDRMMQPIQLHVLDEQHKASVRYVSEMLMPSSRHS
jgi:hypothetical protein